jgi:metal-dependent amidase/aminoacylase/carboxypeptidase family protein
VGRGHVVHAGARPGAYFIVGARGGPETGFPHHNARFDIDERALEVRGRDIAKMAEIG